jgi:hypothetical protein
MTTTWELSKREKDVLAVIARDCDPLPSERPIVSVLAFWGLVEHNAKRARNATGWRVTDQGRQRLQQERA